jgi:hypothetical protein
MKVKKKPLAYKLMKQKPPKGKPGRPAKPMPEKIDATPEEIATVFMNTPPKRKEERVLEGSSD